MSSPPPQITTTLNPRPRRQSGRAISLIALIVVLLLVLGHVLWRNVERRRFIAAVQRLQQAGEPVLMDDFNHAATNDPNNPVPEWRAAAAALDLVSTGNPLYRPDVGEVEFPLTDRELAMLRNVVGANRMTLAHAEVAARKTGQPAWDLTIRSLPALMSLPDLNQQRTVARVLSAAAMDAHQRGDDAEAVARLRQMLALNRAVYRQPGIVGHLVGIGIGERTCDTLQKIAPDLRVGSSRNTGGQPASVEQARRLIADLLEDTPQREGQRYALQYERMMLAEMAIEFANGKFNATVAGGSASPPRPVGGYLLSPMLYADGRTMLELATKVTNAAQLPDWPAAEAKLKLLPDFDRLASARHFMLTIFGMMMHAWDKAVLQDFRALTDKRLTAVALGARWYSTEHDGRFPPKLDDLVPNYLPAIPADPMTAGSRLRHRPGDNPVVYSVGEDGVDDGGSEQPLDPSHPDNRWRQKDIVVHLTRQPRKPKTDDADEQEASEKPPSADASAPLTRPTTSPSADSAGS